MNEVKTFHSNCCFELSEQITACGYEVLALQIEPGLFEARFEIRRVDDALILGITSNVGLRFIGKRNMRVTTFATILQGEGYWKTQPSKWPNVAGFHNREATSNWAMHQVGDGSNPEDLVFGAVLLNREELKSRAELRYPRAAEVMATSNVCTPSLELHQQFNNEASKRFSTGIVTADLMELGLQMLDAPEAVRPVKPASPSEIKLVDSLGEFTRRIADGENLSVEAMAKELDIGATQMTKVMKLLIGMTPKQWISATKAETVLWLLRSEIKRRVYALDDTVRSVARYVGWDERTAQRQMLELTGLKPHQLLALSTH